MITDITVNNKYVLIYNGSIYLSGSLTTGEVTSPHTVETFDTVQEIFDRGLELGLTCTTRDLIKMMEHGAIITPDAEAHLLSYIWEDEYKIYWERMNALGYEKPEEE